MSKSWCDACDGSVPPNAMDAGTDGGETIYVGRAEHEGVMIPGKIHPSHGVCYVAYAGEEHAKSNYQALVGKYWYPCSGGDVPGNAVVAGNDGGEDTYVGRAEHEGVIIPGKVHPSHGVCYVSFAGEEHAKSEYQVLVYGDCSCYRWVPCCSSDIPLGAVKGGTDIDGDNLLIGRKTDDNGVTTPGKVKSSNGMCFIPYAGEEHTYEEDFEVLTMVCVDLD